MKWRALWPLYVAAVFALAWLGWFFWRSHYPASIPYHDSFASGDARDWVALGGTWQIANGAMRNDTDERGAKLLSGSPRWKDYSFTADVQLLGKQGDAGLILRSSDEEAGVDSYRGYYIGLRGNDDQLVIGRADYGWIQLAEHTMPGGVQPFVWYRLKAIVYGCRIAALAQQIPDGPVQTLAYNDENCVSQGRIGLRSHSAGGVWKNLAVLPVSRNDLQITRTAPLASPSPLPYPPLPMPFAVDEPVAVRHGEETVAHSRVRVAAEQAKALSAAVPVESISGLCQVRTQGRVAAVRGAVILTNPGLYIQDATGGVAVTPVKETNLKVGDEVEVTGEVEVHAFSCAMRRAAIRLLWAHAPVPPLAVTATQAATGAFDSRFIEVEGTLTGQSTGPGNTLVLTVRSGSQSFHAIVHPARGDARLSDMPSQAELRIRGVSVVDPEYTHNLTPFVVLVASGDDVEELAGPPWWSLRNLVILGLITLTLGLLAYLLYLHVRHWRVSAIVQERERIAHEMHDTLAQSFVGIGFQLQAISNSVPASLPAINQQLDLACELVRHSHEEATRSLTTLRREFIESETLHQSLYHFAARLVEHGAISVQLVSSGEDTATASAMPYAIKDALFRIGQEAIANAVRHSRPSLLRIQIQYASRGITMNIEDNGSGFTLTQDLRGFGLTGMRRRAERISATFALYTAAGKGTRVEVMAPLPPRLTWLAANRFVLRFTWGGILHGRSKVPDPHSHRR